MLSLKLTRAFPKKSDEIGENAGIRRPKTRSSLECCCHIGNHYEVLIFVICMHNFTRYICCVI